MYYYHIWVRSDRYRGIEALTYHYATRLERGTIIQVPLRTKAVPGFVVAETTRPRFATKPISTILPVQPLPDNSIRLAAWLQQYYATPVGVTTTQFLPVQFHTSYLSNIEPIQQHALIDELPPLTTAQRRALDVIDKPDTYVLHGRTGSGKTRIYLELAKQTISQGGSCFVLTPEIGLTPQLFAQFTKLFGAQTILLHSQLTAKEREIAWLTILQAQTPLVVIGPRSALFSPLHNIGLIVIDEAHDTAYKQEQPPYYHALRVAAQLRSLCDAQLVLGSATPSVVDYYVALEKQKKILRLDRNAIDKSPERRLAIVDLKDRTQFVRSAHISNALIESIQMSLSNKEQVLLYLNRRGTARITLCQTCGWQALCPRCDLPLAYHGDAHRLRCHTCGFEQNPITTCLTCGGKSLQLRSFGTKAIVDEVTKLFPEARVLRVDTDNAKGERIEAQYQRIISGKIDILVGTQMLAKGLDLPLLSTLGVVLADSSLYLPDYTARERTYQLITQVVGRIGRGHIASRAVIQTYDPSSPLLEAALSDDWNKFYEAEIEERRQYFFPPFCHLLKVHCRRSTPDSAERALSQFRDEIIAKGTAITVENPAPSFHEKVSGKYQWQLVIKARSRGQLLKTLTWLPKGWSYDLDPVDLL
jgi:primosomal protein N' (replication factor Y)